MTQRCEKLNALRREAGLCAAWFVKTENIRYLTGYTGEGCLFLSDDRCVILTDSRYTEQAGRQAPEAECIETSRSLAAKTILADLVVDGNVQRLGFEADAVTVTEFETYKEAVKTEFVPMSGFAESLRAVKDADEIACIGEAARIACKAFDQLLGWIRPGMTEKEVQIRLDYEMLLLGSEKNAFDTIACSGVNGSLPHAIPSDHVIAKGELLTLDFGAQYKGYKSDMTRTIAIGNVSDELKAIYNAVLTAQEMALSAIAPGKRGIEIDKIARDYLDSLYPGRFGHGLGHGVGLLVHENPGFNTRDNTALVPGHVVTVEPGVYIPGLGGCRIEDMAIVNETSFTDPITAPKHLITV